MIGCLGLAGTRELGGAFRRPLHRFVVRGAKHLTSFQVESCTQENLGFSLDISESCDVQYITFLQISN